MTALTQMLAAWDDAALTGLVAKGIVIRAGKDAAKATVTERSEGTATVTTSDVTVTITAPDLKAARCTCGTPFPCRHMIAAVIALRQSAPEPLADTPAPPVDTIDIAGLPFAQIERFAGKDWPRALALTAEPVELSGDLTRIVAFEGTAETVTFPAGMDLKQALYKGQTTSRSRMAIAAAALVLARDAGRGLPEATVEAKVLSADPQTLDRVEAALAEAAIALSAGTLRRAADQLFSLAISTRAEAVPRLAAELRGLSKRMTDDGIRQVGDTPETLLLALGRTHALTRALRVAPEDPALNGVLARSFAPSGPKEYAYLGSEHWRTPAGARGLTSIFLDLEAGTFHRATEARAAGTDLTFEPRMAWSKPLWSLVPPSKLRGRRVHLPDAALAPDGGLGLNQRAEAGGPAPGTLQTVLNWQELQTAFDAQMGRGLRQRAGEALMLLEPATTEKPVFDPYAQRWFWPWYDQDEDILDLKLPTDMASAPGLLDTLTRRVARGLVAVAPGGRARLIALWLTGSGAGHYVLQFDPLPKPKGWTALIDKVLDKVALPTTSPVLPPDPLRLALDRAAEATLASLSRPNAPRPIDETRAIGLSKIADGLEALDGRAMSALPLAYLLSLAQTALGERS